VTGDAATVAARFTKHLDEAEVATSSFVARLRPPLTAHP
jgi:hypothetical protein